MTRTLVTLCALALSVTSSLAQTRPFDTSTGTAQGTRPVTFDDIMQMRRVAEPTMSPDGAWVLYTVRQWETSPRDAQKKEQRSQVWRVSATADLAAPAGPGAARQLTFDDAGASAPAWSPDGKYVSFLSSRGSSPAGPGADPPRAQLWIMRTDGGEAARITDSKEAVTSYTWSPDSRRVAFVSRQPEPADDEARRKRGDDRRVYEDEFRLAHLWIVDLPAAAFAADAASAPRGAGSHTETGKATRVTDGDGLAIRSDISWAPDGTRVTFSAAPTPMARDDRQDIFIATLADRRVEKVTTNVGSDAGPKWSPDGNTIAFVSEPSTVKPGPDGLGTQDPRQSRLALLDVKTRAITDASDPSFDYEPRGLLWTNDSRRLLFMVGKGTSVEVFSYDLAARRYQQRTDTKSIITLGNVSRDGGTAALIIESATQPADVHAANTATGAPRRLTNVNPQAADFALGETEVMSWKNEGFDIEGVLVKPVGHKAGAKYPLLVVVHGGPAGAHLNNFRVSYGDGGQHWAGQGWAVLYPNPRGGTNYGEKFMRANIPDWGGGDFRDIMAGVDAAIARGIADPDRLAIQGWSYGGYMTSWAVTQTTRFKAAMVGAGITNLWSMYGTNDLPNYLASFFKGIPSKENLSLYMDRSAVTHAHKAVTPTLILHGANDERVPIGQPMELYRALKEKGTPVELVFYPRQGHGLQEYPHQLDRMKRQFEWITKHTLGGTGRKTTTSQ